MSDVEKVEEQLAKHKKSLMIVTTIITLIYFAGVYVSKINLVVTGLAIGDPIALFYFILVAWFYYFLNYIYFLISTFSIWMGRTTRDFKEQLSLHIFNRVKQDYPNCGEAIREDILKKFLSIDKNQEPLRFTYTYHLTDKDIIVDNTQFKEYGLLRIPAIWITLKNVFKFQFFDFKFFDLTAPIYYVLLVVLLAFAFEKNGTKSFEEFTARKSVVVSFKDINTSSQIMERCHKAHKVENIDYKICVKELEKRLY